MTTEEAIEPDFFTLFPFNDGWKWTVSTIHWLCHRLVELPREIRDTILGFYYSYLIGCIVELAYHEKALEFTALDEVTEQRRRANMYLEVVDWFFTRKRYARHIACRFAERSLYANCLFSIPRGMGRMAPLFYRVEKCRWFYEEANRFGHPVACYGSFWLSARGSPLRDRLRTYPFKDDLLRRFPRLFTDTIRGEWCHSAELADVVLAVFDLLVEEKRDDILRDAVHQHCLCKPARLYYPDESQKVLAALCEWAMEVADEELFFILEQSDSVPMAGIGDTDRL